MSHNSDINSLELQLEWHNADPAKPDYLNDTEIHLWQIPLSLNEQQSKTAIDLLNSRQLGRYQRRLTPQLQDAYLAGRYYLMQLLAGYADIQPKEVKLGYSRLSKPYLTPNPGSLSFNFSDTTHNKKPIGLFAFAKQVELGVDIEALNRTAQFSAIAAKRFSPNELKYVTNEYGETDPGRFLSIWTRKEAYGKATGMGINFRMREIDLYREGGPTLDFVDSQEQTFRLRQIKIGEEFISCVVHSGHQPLGIRAFSLANQAP